MSPVNRSISAVLTLALAASLVSAQSDDPPPAPDACGPEADFQPTNYCLTSSRKSSGLWWRVGCSI